MKQLLFCWVAGNFDVLVPKRRGEGFLRSPYGQHYDAGLSAIESVACCDIYGLDGALSFQCTGGIYHGGDEKRKEFIARVLPLLERHYGLTATEIHQADYWQLNPRMPQKT